MCFSQGKGNMCFSQGKGKYVFSQGKGKYVLVKVTPVYYPISTLYSVKYVFLVKVR